MRKLFFATLILTALLTGSAAAQETTPEPTAEPTSEVTLEPTVEVTSDVTAEPTIEASAEPSSETPAQPSDEPTAEASPDATAESTVPPGAFQDFPGPGSYTVRQPYADLERSYRVYIPTTYVESDPVPLVLVLHGAGGTGVGTESFTGFNDLAETENFVVVYPDGIRNGWNDGRPGYDDVDDVRFLGDVVRFIQGSLSIDPLRIYATGYSMGGMMSYRLGCELPNRFAAVGSVASTMPVYLIPNCADTDPVPVIVFQGTDDSVIPWTGSPNNYLSAAQTIGYWGNHNGCTGDVTIETVADSAMPPDDYTIAVRQQVLDCVADVTVYGIYFGGHTWPGHPFAGPQLGQTAGDIDATALLWEFFEAHPKTESE